MSEDRYMTTSEACKFLHCCRNTLMSWEAKGLVTPLKTDAGHRRYLESDLVNMLGGKRTHKLPKRITVGYCRVSSSGQKGDLERQAQVVTWYCEANGYQFKILKDIGSGLNYEKRGLQMLIDAVCEGSVERVVVSYKDRLMRFGFDIFERICAAHDVEVVVLNLTDDVGAEDELVQDVLSIVSESSAKLYGRRSRKSAKVVAECRKAFENAKGGDGVEKDDGDGAD